MVIFTCKSSCSISRSSTSQGGRVAPFCAETRTWRASAGVRVSSGLPPPELSSWRNLTNVTFDGGILRGIDFWVHDFLSLLDCLGASVIGIWLSVADK